MLALLKIPAAKTTFKIFGSVPALVSERWDRRTIYGDDGVPSVQRIHQEDLCQAMAVPPAQKYQAEHGPGAVDIIKFLRANGFSQVDVLMLIMALVLNFLIVGKDAHAKNYAILEQPGTAPQLAPLYDVASAFTYESPKRNYWILAMSIGGEYNYNRIELHHWHRFVQAADTKTGVTFIEDILYDSSSGACGFRSSGDHGIGAGKRHARTH